MIRPLGTEKQECERSFIGRDVGLSGRRWSIRVVDHLHGTADLVDPWSVYDGLGSPRALKNVPLEDLAAVGACQCGQHLGGARG